MAILNNLLLLVKVIYMVFIKTDDAERVVKDLGLTLSARNIAQAQSRAINVTLRKARTKARGEVKKVYNISQKNLDGIDYRKATSSNLRGELVASQKPLPLDAFAPIQVGRTGSIQITKRGARKVKHFRREKKNVPGGVSIEIFKGKRQVIPFAFMLPNGALRVFARGEYKGNKQFGFVQRFHRVNKTGSDLPIKPLITLSVYGEVLNDKVMGAIKTEVSGEYPKILENQLKNVLDINKRMRHG